MTLPSSLRRLPSKAVLERMYRRYNDRRFVAYDPVGLVHAYDAPADQEIAALCAALFAFGNAKVICRTVQQLLHALGTPYGGLMRLTPAEFRRDFCRFRYRWVRAKDLEELLFAVQSMLREFESIGEAARASDDPTSPTIIPTLKRFVETLHSHGVRPKNPLVPHPDDGSACKRWCMLWRWMVRRDAIDLGLWEAMNPARLVVPLDTHLFHVCRKWNLTQRQTAGLPTALEITAAFRELCPSDPVRYDFALTRPGILQTWLRSTHAAPAIHALA